MSDCNSWLQWFQPLSVAALACVGAWIAWQQKDIAAEKLKLERFDRRFRVFDATRRFLAHILTTGTVDPKEEREFWIATGDAIFLFDPEIEAYLEDLRVRAINFPTINKEMGGSEKRRLAFEQFQTDMKTLPERFNKFLAFKRH